MYLFRTEGFFDFDFLFLFSLNFCQPTVRIVERMRSWDDAVRYRIYAIYSRASAMSGTEC